MGTRTPVNAPEVADWRAFDVEEGHEDYAVVEMAWEVLSALNGLFLVAEFNDYCRLLSTGIRDFPVL